MTFIQLLFCHSQGHGEASGDPAVRSNAEQDDTDYTTAKNMYRLSGK